MKSITNVKLNTKGNAMNKTHLLFQPVAAVVDLVGPPVEVVPGLLVLEAVAAPVVLGAVLEFNSLLSKLRPATPGLLYRGQRSPIFQSLGGSSWVSADSALPNWSN